MVKEVVKTPPSSLLPRTRSAVENHWTKQKIGMIGSAGIGKSEFWSHCNGLYLQTEAGLNHLSVMKVELRAWDEFTKVYAELVKAEKSNDFPYDTIVIDTIDNFVDLVHGEVVERGREKFRNVPVNTIGDIPNGAGWFWAQQLMDNTLAKLEGLPACVVYVGHLESREVKEPTRSIHKQTISIGGKMGGLLTAWPDHLLNIESNFVGQKQVRKVRTIPTATVEAKSRGGVIPDGWVWEADSKKNWEKLRSLFQ